MLTPRAQAQLRDRAARKRLARPLPRVEQADVAEAPAAPQRPLALGGIAAIARTTATLRAERTEALRGDTGAAHDAAAAIAAFDELEKRIYAAVRCCEVACGYSIVEHVRGVARIVREAEGRTSARRDAEQLTQGYNPAEGIV